MVRGFISCALRREGLGILNGIDYQFLPIREDTEKWVYVPVVRERCSRVGYAGNITGWSGKENIELRAEYRRAKQERPNGIGKHDNLIVANSLYRTGYSCLADGFLYHHAQPLSACATN
ncbi:MAG: hypothetical protein V3T23_03655 [Nitrososphaerales archaeon]